MIPRARPVDIPADLAAWIEIGGPWSVRLIYAGYLLRYVLTLVAPWRARAVLEMRRRVIEEIQA